MNTPWSRRLAVLVGAATIALIGVAVQPALAHPTPTPSGGTTPTPSVSASGAVTPSPNVSMSRSRTPSPSASMSRTGTPSPNVSPSRTRTPSPHTSTPPASGVVLGRPLLIGLGRALVSVTYSCPAPARANLAVTLAQRSGRGYLTASARLSGLVCGPRPHTRLLLLSPNRPFIFPRPSGFRRGPAVESAVLTCGGFFGACPSAVTTRLVIII